MRIVVVILGLAAGLFALLGPIVLKSDVLAQFIAAWPQSETTRLLATQIWYAAPAAAVVGGLIALVAPGIASVFLLAAAITWAGIGYAALAVFDPATLFPTFFAGLAAIMALVAGELDVHRRRVARRARRPGPDLDAREEEDLEAALTMDPVRVARDEFAPPSRHSIPLTIGDVAVRSPPSGPPPRWQHLDADEPSPLRPTPRFKPDRVEPDIAQPTVEFRWGRDDEPELVPPQRPKQGPRFVPRSEPEMAPRLQPDPESLAEAEEEPEDWPLPSAGRPRAEELEDAWPAPRGSTFAARRPVVSSRGSRSGAGPLMPVLAGFAAFAVFLAIGVGGFLAYRAGLVDQLASTFLPTEKPAGADGSSEASSSADPGVLAAPAATPAPQPTLPVEALPPVVVGTTEPTETSFEDPFAYCAALGTIDYVDSRYRGPAVVAAMTRALSLTTDASRDRVRWRCDSGRVLACSSYLGPICDMVPTLSEMKAYCAGHPNVEVILAPHGIWSCVAGVAKVPEDARWHVDARGFMPRAWVAVSPDTVPPA